MVYNLETTSATLIEEVPDNLAEFILNANQNSARFMRHPNIFRDKFFKIHGSFITAIKNLTNIKPLEPAFFLLRTHSAFLASVRLVSAGHLAESYPLLRSVLENALYGFFVWKKPEEFVAWLNRNDSKKAKDKATGHFAIGPIKKSLGKHNGVLGSVIDTLYERSVDFGAHPNSRSHLTNLTIHNSNDAMIFQAKYLGGDLHSIQLAMKTTAQVGTAALLIFADIYRTRFQLLNLDKALRSLRKGL